MEKEQRLILKNAINNIRLATAHIENIAEQVEEQFNELTFAQLKKSGRIEDRSITLNYLVSLLHEFEQTVENNKKLLSR